MRTIMERLAREPAAVGTLVASVLPALVALGVISLDEQAIGLLVVAVNGIVGFAVRLVVVPTSTQPAALHTEQDLATG
jgi:hypothetical protein